uniref:Uncharacterized protein n=1 Tax=Alexandrium monilatum TaxID=311494 RepID=A0A7S4RU50_9DINO|mmetsp:Transcript_97357/g.303603  ORF Transcript_97357/g.303603 Transcript_97357/m.303603 type:complete len:253 (+) Transcript_97357:73-831(+)
MPPMPLPSQRRLPMMFFQRPMEKLFGETRSVESDQESSEGDEIPDWDRRPVRPAPGKPGVTERVLSNRSSARQPKQPGLMAPSSSWGAAAARAAAVAARRSALWTEEQLQQLHSLCKLQEGQIAQLRSDLSALQQQLAAQAETSRTELADLSSLRADVAEIRAEGGPLHHSEEEDARRRDRFEQLFARAEEQVRQLQARVKEVALMPALTEEQVQQFETRDKTPAPTADPDTGNRQEERRQDVPGPAGPAEG